MGGPADIGGANASRPAYRAGARDSSMPVRIVAQAKLDPIKSPHTGFDARDFAANVLVISFFTLVFFAPLILIGAVAFRFVR